MKVDLSRYTNRHSKGGKFKRLLWDIVWFFFGRPTPRWCLNGWRCFLLRLFGAKIGKGVRVQGSVKVWQPWKLKIGAGSWIDGGVSLYSVDEITIGSNAVVSEGAFICTATHDISSEVFELVTKPIGIADSAWICARAVVMPGVSIAEGAVVAAGAIATKNVSPWTVVAGNPAKEVKKRAIKA